MIRIELREGDEELDYYIGRHLLSDMYFEGGYNNYVSRPHFITNFTKFMMSTYTSECLFYEGTELVGAVIMGLYDDVHYGRVAKPLVSYLKPEYRTYTNAKLVALAENMGAKDLGMRYFIRCKHLTSVIKQETLKRVK